jgi:superfamily II DNA helicase RecQ
MALLTQYASFFISPFGEKSVCDELNAFIKSHRVVNVEKRLIDGERGTGWVFLVEYGADNKNQPAASAPRVDYREVLTDQEYALFDKLRALRKEIAEKQGIPVYAVFTNDNLAGMVRKIPKTPGELLALPGIGEARVKQYGGAFLNVLTEHTGKDDETAKLPL